MRRRPCLLQANARLAASAQRQGPEIGTRALWRDARRTSNLSVQRHAVRRPRAGFVESKAVGRDGERTSSLGRLDKTGRVRWEFKGRPLQQLAAIALIPDPCWHTDPRAHLEEERPAPDDRFSQVDRCETRDTRPRDADITGERQQRDPGSLAVRSVLLSGSAPARRPRGPTEVFLVGVSRAAPQFGNFDAIGLALPLFLIIRAQWHRNRALPASA